MYIFTIFRTNVRWGKADSLFLQKNNLFYGGSAQWNWNFVYSTHFRRFAGRRYLPYNFMFFWNNICKISSEGITPPSRDSWLPLSIIDHRVCFLKEMYLGTFSHRARSLATLYIIITLERTWYPWTFNPISIRTSPAFTRSWMSKKTSISSTTLSLLRTKKPACTSLTASQRTRSFCAWCRISPP